MIVEYTAVGDDFDKIGDVISKSGYSYVVNPQGHTSLVTHDVFTDDDEYLQGKLHYKLLALSCDFKVYSDEDYKIKEDKRGV